MSGRSLIFAGLIAALTVSTPVQAQEAGKVYRIGWLTASTINHTFRQAMRELGYIEGKNLAFEYRQAKILGQYPRLAKELVALNVDLLLTVGVSATRAAKQATRTIPIVMGNSSADPVRQGLIDSLARPGGNVTGVFDLMPDLAGKRVELLKEIFPKLSNIVHFSPGGPVGTAHLLKVQAAADALGVRVQAVTVKQPADLDRAFRTAAAGNAEAAILVGVSFFIPHRPQIVDLEAKYSLPTMHTHLRWVSAGGFVSYTTDSELRFRRAAEYVDRILRGARPADMPVEQPKKYVLEVNLKTARSLGVTIPRSVLLRADRVIE